MCLKSYELDWSLEEEVGVRSMHSTLLTDAALLGARDGCPQITCQSCNDPSEETCVVPRLNELTFCFLRQTRLTLCFEKRPRFGNCGVVKPSVHLHVQLTEESFGKYGFQNRPTCHIKLEKFERKMALARWAPERFARFSLRWRPHDKWWHA